MRSFAIDRDSGETKWHADLKGSDFVNVTLQDGVLLAAEKKRRDDQAAAGAAVAASS